MSGYKVAPYTPQTVNDIRSMSRRKSFDEIRQILGWTANRLNKVCLTHGIDFPIVSTAKPVSAEEIAARIPKPNRHVVKGGLRDGRCIRFAVITTMPIAENIARYAAESGLAPGRLLHELLAIIQRRNLWSDLLNSSPVASMRQTETLTSEE